MLKFPSINLKAVLKAIFINWWWGFWRRKPKNNPSIETEDFFIGISMSSPYIIEDDDASGLVLTEAGLFHNSWKENRLWLADGGEDPVKCIKALRIASGVGSIKAPTLLHDNAGTVSSLIGPLSMSLEDVQSLLHKAGAEVEVVEIDTEDGQLSSENSQRWNDMCLQANGGEIGSRWLFVEAMQDIPHFFIVPQESYDDHVHFWDPNGGDGEAPEDILFGHEDTELV